MYGAIFFIIGTVFANGGLLNAAPSPYHVLGWVCYTIIESYGSVMGA
jgi:hypothetical protein